VYKDFFLKTGKRLENVLQISPVDPAFSYHFADGKKVQFSNLAHHKTRAAISAAFGQVAGDDWHKIMRRAERMWSASRVQFVESELLSIFNLLKSKSIFRDLIEIAPFTSLRKLINRYTDSPYILKIIDRYATYTGSDPRKVPAVLLTIAFVEEAFGAWHLKGGIGKLSEALEQRCRDLGVEIYLNQPVREAVTNDAWRVRFGLGSNNEYGGFC
jgi:phytoene dehydrogenase-like protein